MGCVKLHLLNQQYKNTELKVSYLNKELTLKNSAVNERRAILVRFIDPNGKEPNYFGIKDKQKYGVMVVLPNSWHNDTALKDVFKTAKANGIPVIFVDNIKDLKDGMNHLKKIGVSVNAYSLTQHGGPGKTKIGEQVVNSKTDFSSLKEGFSGKNILINACNVAKDGNIQGKELVKKISVETNSTAVVASEQRMNAGADFQKGHNLNEIDEHGNDVGNNYIIQLQGQNQKSIIDFSVGRNGTFYWSY